jgi:hypothetical protein
MSMLTYEISWSHIVLFSRKKIEKSVNYIYQLRQLICSGWSINIYFGSLVSS